MNDNEVTLSKIAYSIVEAAEALSVGRTTVYKLIGENKIPTRKIGGRVVILREDLVAYAKALPVAESDRPAA